MDHLAFRDLHHLLALSGSGMRGNSSNFYLVSPRVLAALRRLRPSAQALEFSNRDTSVPKLVCEHPADIPLGGMLGEQLLTVIFSRMAFSAAGSVSLRRTRVLLLGGDWKDGFLPVWELWCGSTRGTYSDPSAGRPRRTAPQKRRGTASLKRIARRGGGPSLRDGLSTRCAHTKPFGNYNAIRSPKPPFDDANPGKRGDP